MRAGRALYWRLFGVLVILWLAFVGARCGRSGGRVVFEEGRLVHEAGDRCGHGLRHAGVRRFPAHRQRRGRGDGDGNQERLASLAMALVNVETGEGLDFGLELSFYAGVEDGEAWVGGIRATRA